MFTSRASIGIALSGRRPTRAETLLRDADAAMYRAKERGARPRSSCSTRDARRGGRAPAHRAARCAARCSATSCACTTSRLVDLESREIVAVEALVRWEHPGAGWCRPATSSASPRRAGLMQQLGVLRELGCERAQGYALARPAAAEAIAGLVSPARAAPWSGRRR